MASAGGFQELVDGEGGVLYLYGVCAGVYHYVEGLADGGAGVQGRVIDGHRYEVGKDRISGVVCRNLIHLI